MTSALAFEAHRVSIASHIAPPAMPLDAACSEFLEFARNVLKQLRQPMEEGAVTIARTNSSTRFPARFMLVAAMNPGPCRPRLN